MFQDAIPTQLSLSKSERVFLLLLALVQFTHILDFMILMPLGDLLMKIFKITPQQFSFIVAAYTFSAGISGFVSAFFIDRFDRKRALIFVYSGFIIGTFGCAIAPTYEFLLVARSVAGLFGGVMGALILSMVGDAIPNIRRGQAMGTVMASFSLASVVGVPFGLYLANLFSWHAPFILVGVIGLVNMILIGARIPNMNKHLVAVHERPNPKQVIAAVTNDPNQVRALVFTFLLMLSQFCLIPFISPYLVSNVGFTQEQLPLIYLCGGGLTIFTSPLVGKLADRLGKARIFTIGGILLMIPYFLITNLGHVGVPVALVITTLFFVLGNGRFIPAMAMVTATVRPESRGSFMSINSCVQSIGSSTAAFLSGMIVIRAASGELQRYNYVGYFAIAISILAIYIGRHLVPRET